MNKKLAVFFILLPIGVGFFAIPNMINGTRTEIAISQDRQAAIAPYSSLFNAILSHCTTTNDPTCQQQVQQQLQQCSYFGNPPICSDSRIANILKN